MVAARLSITASDLDEKALKKVFDQITRDVPVGRGQHADDRVLVNAAQWVFRINVTGDFGIVTEDFGAT